MIKDFWSFYSCLMNYLSHNLGLTIHCICLATYRALTPVPKGGAAPLFKNGVRVSQRLRDLDLGARVASWTRQSAIHTTQHATRSTTTPPTHIGGHLQWPLGNRVPQHLRVRLTAWARRINS